MLAQTGLVAASVARAYKVGSISAKLVVALAQTLNISPFFLTGESDEHGECSEEQLVQLLTAHGYAKLLAEQTGAEHKRVARKTREKPALEEPPAEEQENRAGESMSQNGIGLEAFLSCVKSSLQPDAIGFLNSLTEADLVLLLQSVLLRAKAGGPNAALATAIKWLLTR